jgi:hypothetical protein
MAEGQQQPIVPELDLIRLPTENPPNSPDQQTIQEVQSLDDARQRAIIAGLEQDREERKKYAHRIFVLICTWIGGVFAIVVAQGIGCHFSLAEGVVLAVIGTTTVNVLGIFYIVAHYLFPNPPVDKR